MGLGLRKQAKILSKAQADAVVCWLNSTRKPYRNKAVFFLSMKAGLRAKEIASLKWSMVCDAEGNLDDAIHLPNSASKGQSGRVIPMNKDLKQALSVLWHERDGRSDFVITTERASKTSAAAIVNMFRYWYAALGFQGASSHSGRRTAITHWARKISSVGGSLRDVQALAGHSALTTTQRYIESDVMAQRRVVDVI